MANIIDAFTNPKKPVAPQPGAATNGNIIDQFANANPAASTNGGNITDRFADAAGAGADFQQPMDRAQMGGVVGPATGQTQLPAGKQTPASAAVLAAQAAATGGTPAPAAPAAAPAAAQPPTPSTPSPVPGWVPSFDGSGWVPPDHPQAWKAPTAGAPGTPAAPGAPATTNANTVPGQANAAQTYSTTAGAAPLENTTNQGTQDVVRNSYLQQGTQGTTIDPNDPNIKQQLDPFVAAQERSRKQYEAEQAERLSASGLGSSGVMQNERRLGAERAGQASGAMHSQLVTRELENRRSEIKDALSGLRGMISDDQARALQKQLGELDASIKREGIRSGNAISSAELQLKDKLGTGALNMDMVRALLQNQQFGAGQNQQQNQFLDRLGFDVSGRQADWDWTQRGN